MYLPRTLIMLLAATALTACSDSEPQARSTVQQAKQPCDLLTAEDIQQVTGQAMQPGVEKYKTFCFFSSVEKSGPFDLPKYQWQLQYLHHDVPPEQEAQQYQAMMKEGLGKEAKDLVSTPVSGMGDWAIWQHYANVTQLVVIKSAGDKASDFIAVQPDFDTEAEALEDAKALAQRALKRL
jgi:hypothetical protein